MTLDLSTPLGNRLCHLTWDINPRVIADGLAGGCARPQVPELAGGWEAEEILARGLVAAFLRVRPALACAPVQRVSSARQVELIGGVGTDIGAGIAAAGALRPRPAITVVLTDGYTPWPDRAPEGMRVVVALLGDAPPDGPAWARAVRVPAPAA